MLPVAMGYVSYRPHGLVYGPILKPGHPRWVKWGVYWYEESLLCPMKGSFFMSIDSCGSWQIVGLGGSMGPNRQFLQPLTPFFMTWK